MVVQRQAEHERLGDRLDGEQLLVIADVVSLAVDGDDRDAEPVGVGLGELGDVVGDLAVVDAAILGVQLLQRRRGTARRRLRGCRSGRRAQRIRIVVGMAGTGELTG